MGEEKQKDAIPFPEGKDARYASIKQRHDAIKKRWTDVIDALPKLEGSLATREPTVFRDVTAPLLTPIPGCLNFLAEGAAPLELVNKCERNLDLLEQYLAAFDVNEEFQRGELTAAGAYNDFYESLQKNPPPEGFAVGYIRAALERLRERQVKTGERSS